MNIPKYEDSYTEFKQEQVRNEGLVKEICAFSNFKGGRIFIGVDDNGTILGVEDPKKMEEKLFQICHHSLHPALTPSIRIEEVEDKTILIVDIPQGVQKPYAVKKQDRSVYYIRNGSISREASREELIRLAQASGMIHFEITSVPRTEWKDLDQRRVEDYFYRIRKVEKSPDHNQEFWKDLLYNTDYLVREEESSPLRTSIAGLSLFGRNPKRYLHGVSVTAVSFSGTVEDYDNMGLDTISGPLVDLYDSFGVPIEKGIISQTMDFCQRFLSTEKLEGVARKRDWQIPPEAIRELILNAFIHRDYTITTDVSIKIFSDRLEVTSPGSLPNTVSIAKIKAGCRYPRNPILVETARDYGYIEHLGMGIVRKVISNMQRFNGKDPEFIETEDQLTVILRK